MLIVERVSSSSSFYDQFEVSLDNVYKANHLEYFEDLYKSEAAKLEEKRKAHGLTISYEDLTHTPRPKLIRKKVISYEKVSRHGVKQIQNYKF